MQRNIQRENIHQRFHDSGLPLQYIAFFRVYLATLLKDLKYIFLRDIPVEAAFFSRPPWLLQLAR
jgi:hypothetical protein